jgi:hypothetical protein
MSPAACANWPNVFVSGKVNATPFGMHVKIAHCIRWRDDSLLGTSCQRMSASSTSHCIGGTKVFEVCVTEG